MSSYEGRIRAVERYIKLGTRVRATIRLHMQAAHLKQRAKRAFLLVARPCQGQAMPFDAHRPSAAPH